MICMISSESLCKAWLVLLDTSRRRTVCTSLANAIFLTRMIPQWAYVALNMSVRLHNHSESCSKKF